MVSQLKQSGIHKISCQQKDDIACKLFLFKNHNIFSEYLLREDCNSISVDWSALAEGDHETVTLINAPIAGAATGAFVDFLIRQGTPLSAFHLIGFSMARVVGNAGAAVAAGILPRITGLDPASENFPLDSIG
ncbi:hypothetical protein GHT06_014380 [Daphnia sinensis]|uniref:Lipase domain-containing protein n=1 Tax=Daphnia sinensis TaxID=1820382 RepID=A0AAD5LDR7_9CRUS|nr:hypothetical protein GHT06_014380 [Daphnia sinensis]